MIVDLGYTVSEVILACNHGKTCTRYLFSVHFVLHVLEFVWNRN